MRERERTIRGSLETRCATWQVWQAGRQAGRAGAQAKGEGGLDFGRDGGY